MLGCVLEAGTLPRELQRAMARDLRAVFPDMPPVRDFRALAASAARARQEVRDVLRERVHRLTCSYSSSFGVLAFVFVCAYVWRLPQP